MSGIADSTLRRMERGEGRTHGSSWHRVLEALAGIAPFSPDEIRRIATETGLTPGAVASINAKAQPASPDDRRRTARSRITAVLDAHPDRLDHIADLLESAARAFGPG